MSALESSVAPTLGPMIRHGRPTILTVPEQQMIAKWAVKTAFMLGHLDPNGQVMSKAEHTQFYALARPLPSHLVWLAHRQALKDESGRELFAASRQQLVDYMDVSESRSSQLQTLIDKGYNAYRVTFTIGHAVFQVFGHTFPEVIDVKSQPHLAAVRRLIWPSAQDVAWPPGAHIELIGGLDGLHQTFQ